MSKLPMTVGFGLARMKWSRRTSIFTGMDGGNAKHAEHFEVGDAISRKRHKVDTCATTAAGFADDRSYVTLFGKEFLFGDDMRRRRYAVWNRDHWRCVLCHVAVSVDEESASPNPMELDHFPVSRGRGGDDSMSNLRTLCASCHRQRLVRPRFTKQLVGARDGD